ncbi:hypothetical protein JCM3774_001986 [Rhodotorula dairenensis]
MDWSAFAPDRPPGSSPAPHAALTSSTSPVSPTWPPGARAALTTSSQFGPGQLAAGLDQVHLATTAGGGGSSGTSPSAMYPYAPYGSHAPLPPPVPSSSSSKAAAAAPPSGYGAASSRPRPPPPQLAPLVPPGNLGSPNRPSPSSTSSASPLRTSSRTAAAMGTTPTSPALPPLPPPTGAPPALPASASYSSLNGMSQSSHASSNTAPAHRSSPTSRRAPTPAAATTTTTKRANPLEDLIATETVYVQDLGVVIKRVAAAWSRANFPPPHLDGMFRAIEAVYRVNKALLAKLLEIGPNPSSPKALGDLLMRWVDDVEPAYTRYATTYALDYDSFEPVQSNPNLAPILADLDWPASLPVQPQSRVTLDRLFELPLYRIQYYQRLYAKLLRSTQEGRSDHALLVSANEKLAQLEVLCEEGKRRSVVPPSQPTEPDRPGQEVESAERPVVAARGEERSHLGSEAVPDPPPRDEKPAVPPPPLEQEHKRRSPPRLQLDMPASRPATSDSESSRSRPGAGAGAAPQRTSNDSATFDSPLSSESLRSSGATGISTANTSTIQSFSPTPPDGLAEKPLRIEDLERRLNTDRTLDIFTMQPRRCKLQIQPASLPFQRELRFAATAHVSFTPASDPAGRTVTHPHARILLLTDLFLVCERVAPEESGSANGADFWLVYPPLAGKHLRASQQDLDSVEVTVMQRERLVVRFDGADAVARARDLASAVQAAAGFVAVAPAPVPPPLRQNSLASAYGHTLQSPLSSHGHNPGGSSLSPAPPSGARPQLQLQPLQPPFGLDPSRRVVSGPGAAGSSSSSSAVPRPTRGASMHNQSPGGGLVQSPSSTSFQHGGSSRGTSPFPSEDRYSLNSSGSPYAPAPRRSSRSTSDFGGGGSGGGGDRPDSRQSNGSYSSNRTDSFGRWPEAPPPLPKERTYNGLDISGRGGPLYATSFRGDNNNLHVPAASSSTTANMMHRARSADALRSDALQQQMHYRMPSQTLLEDRSSSAPGSSRSVSASGGGAGRVVPEQSFGDVSPPTSPVKSTVPDKTAVTAQMRCKVFLQQHHSVWKSLGTAKLRLFHSLPSNRKQLVVDSDKRGGKTIISTIVLEDGVERVGKTGVAVELSHEGDRTGIVHMLQLKTEQSAVGLFEQLLLGTDRARR